MLLLALTLAPPESKDFVQVLLLLTKNWAANQKNIGNPSYVAYGCHEAKPVISACSPKKGILLFLLLFSSHRMVKLGSEKLRCQTLS